MPITYYPTRIQKKTTPAIDASITHNPEKSFRYAQDTSSTALIQTLSNSKDWVVNSISFHFSDAVVRDYSLKVLRGIYVVENYNDYLWIQVSNSLWQRISLTAGFYTGNQLALHLRDQLNANTAFAALGVTFTVAYDSITGLFTITPSKNSVRYIDRNDTQALRYRQSTAGQLFGFTTDTSFAASISSDTPIYGLNHKIAIIDETESVATEHYHDDLHHLSADQALRIRSSVAAVEVSIEVTYQDED